MTIITHTPDVLGGEPRIEGTRIGVIHIKEMVRGAEWSKEETASELNLEIEDVERALEFYDSRLDEMQKWEQYRENILENELEASQDIGA